MSTEQPTTTNNQQTTTNNQQPTTNNQQPTNNHQQTTTNKNYLILRPQALIKASTGNSTALTHNQIIKVRWPKKAETAQKSGNQAQGLSGNGGKIRELSQIIAGGSKTSKPAPSQSPQPNSTSAPMPCQRRPFQYQVRGCSPSTIVMQFCRRSAVKICWQK